MMALDDQGVSDTLDYLGQAQPLASPRLSTLPSASAGGGTVSPPVTPTATQPGAPSTPMGQMPSAPGASPLAMASAAFSLAQKTSRGASEFSKLFEDPNALLPGATRGPTGNISLSDQVRSLEAAGVGVPNAPGIFTGAEASMATEAEQGLAEAAGAGFGETVGQALPFVGAAIPLISSFARGGPQNATEAANLAVQTAAAVAAPFTFGASEAAVGIAQGIEDIMAGAPAWRTILDFGGLGMLSSFFENPGVYGPKRAEAGKEAGADLASLSQSYQAAATSGDPAQILQALSTGQGERGAVRSLLTLNPEVATALGLSSGNVEWSTLSPEQFTGVLRYFQQHPDAIASAITGSGDVGYLPQEQAQQVAGRAAEDAQGLMTFLVNQMAGPATPTAPTPSAPPAPLPTAPAGPAGALGFASDMMAA